MSRASPARTPYMHLRGASYYFRYVLPSTVTAQIGRKVVKISLRTAYIRLACERAATVLSGLREIIPSLSSGANGAATMEGLREKLELFLKEMNSRWIDGHLGRSRPLEEDGLEDELDTLESVRSDCMEALQTGNWRRWVQLAKEFAQEHSLQIEEGGGEFRELCFEIGKLESRTLGYSLASLRGDYPIPDYFVPKLEASGQPVALTETAFKGHQALLLSEAYEKFCEWKAISGKWKRPEVSRAHDYDPIIPPFIASVGDKPVGALTLDDTERYATTTLSKTTVTLGTKKRDLDRVKAFLNYASSRLGAPNVIGPLSLDKEYKAIHESYEPFNASDLEKLFHSEQYRGNSFRKASHFWLPLIGLYTGARIDEPASMLLKDIVRHEGIDAFYMSGDGNKGGKNDFAPRWVPIHPNLIKAGFLEYVSLLKEEGHTRLFPDIGEAARDGFGKRATVDFTAYRRSVGVGALDGRSKKVFHSFRSTMSIRLAATGADGETARRLVGHAAKDVHGNVYLMHLGADWLAPALAALERLDYGLVHPRWQDTETYRKARRRKVS